ncbi:MAG TPA: GNAT family N-acetyltransferase [Chloroflexia bacterium]|nr:GNAT family N-acetyltransferase [Chloroflexia bacterium]
MPAGTDSARPNESVRLRPARLEDSDAIIALIVGLAAYEKLPPPNEEAQQRLLRDAFGERPRFEIILAELDSRPVAYAFVFETYSTFLALPTLYLEDIFVLPEYRGRGVGNSMMQFLAREAHRRGCGRMEWVVLDWNRPAIDFYERLGAIHLAEWLTYRLDRENLGRLAGEGEA